MNAMIAAELSSAVTLSTDLDRAIELLRRHHYTVQPPVGARAFIAVGDLRLDLQARVLNFCGSEVDLSPSQTRIVQVLMESCGDWCSRQWIQKKLWGKSEPSSDALSVHMCNVRKKLQSVSGVAYPVLTRRSAGYQLAPFFWRLSTHR